MKERCRAGLHVPLGQVRPDRSEVQAVLDSVIDTSDTKF